MLKIMGLSWSDNNEVFFLFLFSQAPPPPLSEWFKVSRAALWLVAEVFVSGDNSRVLRVPAAHQPRELKDKAEWGILLSNTAG